MEPINKDLQLLLLVLVCETEVALIGGVEFFVSLDYLGPSVLRETQTTRKRNVIIE